MKKKRYGRPKKVMTIKQSGIRAQIDISTSDEKLLVIRILRRRNIKHRFDPIYMYLAINDLMACTDGNIPKGKCINPNVIHFMRGLKKPHII